MLAIHGTKSFADVLYTLRLKMMGAAPVAGLTRAATREIFELRNVTFEVDLAGNEDLAHWAAQLEATPEADESFDMYRSRFPYDRRFLDPPDNASLTGYCTPITRDGALHLFRPLKRTDFRRALRNEIYFSIRLMHWLLIECRLNRPQAWDTVKLGTLAMFVASLHVYEIDKRELIEGKW